jgi:uncharacterized protein YbjQ (UPF0145 family)
MKAKDFCNEHGIDEQSFEEWIYTTSYKYSFGMTGDDMKLKDNQDFDQMLSDYREHLAEYARQHADEIASSEREKKEDAAMRKATSEMLITSGFNFDGFTITKYSGYISGDDAVEINRGAEGLFSSATNVGESLLNSLVHIRRNALQELKEAAYALGCNAVIGVDFDYITLDPETAGYGGRTVYMPYVFGVTANGNAVIIEKSKKSS